MLVRRTYRNLGEILFDKLDSFGFQYTSEQKLYKSLALFDFGSICVQDETLKDTNRTICIRKQFPISLSISSNLVEKPFFICNADPHHLVASFIGSFVNLAAQSKAKMKNLFLIIKRTIKIKLGSI